MPLPDVDASRAVLIGTAGYRHLEPLPSVADHLSALAARLRDPDLWGLPEEHCTVVLDPGSAGELLDVVHRAAREATDTLLICYAGHALLDDGSELLLTLPGSDTEHLYRSVRYADLRREILGARCRARATILDCAYDGPVVPDLADRAAVDGGWLLMGMTPDAPAVTGELVSVLDRGIADGPDLIDTDALYLRMRSTVRPQQRSRHPGPPITLFKNRAPHHAAAELPRIDERPYLRLTPSALAETVAALRADGRADTAAAVLAAGGRHRPDQEVASIMVMLASLGRAGDVAEVAFAAATRDPHELLGIYRVLVEIDQRAVALGLLKVVAMGLPERTARLVEALEPTDDALALLLRAAVVAGKERPRRVADLFHALLRQPRREAADLLMSVARSVLTPENLAVVADELRDGGRDAVAYPLYGAAADAVIRREPAQIALMVATLDGDAGRALAREAVTAFRTSRPDRLADLVAALEGAALDEAVHTLGTTLPRVRLDEIYRELRDRGREEVAFRLYLAAATDRPVEDILRLHESLVDQGRPMDALDLLTHAAQVRPVADLERLTTAGTGSGNRRVFAEAARQRPHRSAALYRILSARDDGRREQLAAELLRRPDADLVAVVADLLESGAGIAARDLLRAAVGPSGGRIPQRLAAAAVEGGQTRTALTVAELAGDDELPEIVDGIRRSFPDPAAAERAVAPYLAELPRQAIQAWFGTGDGGSGLLHALAVRPAGELVTVTSAVTRPGSTGAARDLLASAADRPLTGVAEVIIELRRRGERDHLRTFVDALRDRQRADTDYFQLASWLWLLGEQDLARLTLRDRLWLPDDRIGDTLALAVADHLHAYAVSTGILGWAYPDLMVSEDVKELRRRYRLPAGTAYLLALPATRARAVPPVVFTDRGVHHVKGLACTYAELRRVTVTAGRRSTVVVGADEHGWTMSSPADAKELAGLLTGIQEVARRFPDTSRAATYLASQPVPAGDVIDSYDLEGEVG